MARPTIDPSVLASLTAAVPGRLLRTLDATPDLAEAWTWTSEGDTWSVATDGEAVVRVAGAHVAAPSQVTCGCLLAPRCLHALAVATRLPLGVAAHDEAVESAPDAPLEAGAVALDAAQVAAAAHLGSIAAEILAAGATSVGAVRQAELLRALHACRASGLHRAATAAVAVARGVQGARGRRPTVRADDLAASTHALLRVTAALTAPGPISPTFIGRARRAFAPLAGRRLYGLFCEPVLTASGHAGVVTWLADASGNLFRLSDVMQGGAARVAAAYAGETQFGEVRLTHRALCRAGLLLQRGSCSADGRLGGGASVEAVANGACAWDAPPLAALWAEPLTAQLRRALDAETDLEAAAPGADLVFLRGHVLGAEADALVLDIGGLTVHCTVSHPDPTLDQRGALRRLASAPGLSLRVILRPDRARTRTAALLAFGPADDGLRLPERWGDRAHPGLESLQGAMLPAATPSGPPLSLRRAPPAADPLDPLRRRLYRVPLGGRATIPAEAADEIARDVARLERDHFPAIGAALRAVAVTAAAAPRGPWGTREVPDAATLARAWTLAMTALEAAAATLRRDGWG